MAQHYSDPTRERDAYSLPNVETFYLTPREFLQASPESWLAEALSNHSMAAEAAAADLAGWYYWYCLPGCLPDSDPVGPFATEADALADARESTGDDEDDSESDGE